MNRRKFLLLLSSCSLITAFSSSTKESYYVEWGLGSLEFKEVVALILEYFLEKGLRNVTLSEEETKKLVAGGYDRPLPELELKAGPRIWVTAFKEAENKIGVHWIWAQAGCHAAKNITGVNERMADLPSFLENKLKSNVVVSAGE